VKIAIIGAGAIGSLLGGFFKKAGYDATLIDNSVERSHIVSKQGLFISGVSGDHHVMIPSTTKSDFHGNFDLIFVCVKAYDTEQAVRKNMSLIGPNTTMITLQNGLGNIETIIEIIGPEKVLAGTTTMGAFQEKPGYIHHAGLGETVIGEISGKITSRLEIIAGILNDSNIACSISANIYQLLWSKVIVNAGINAMTSLLHVKNGVIVEIEETQWIMYEVVKEAIQTARACGIDLDTDLMLKKVEDVARRTSQNRSSMLTDVINKKRTEIDFINGAIVREAKKHDITVPFNEMLHKLVKALEKTYYCQELL